MTTLPLNLAAGVRLRLWILLVCAFGPCLARQITVINSCSTTIWPGLFTGGSVIPSQVTGWELASGGNTTFQVDDNWTSGRVWARTGCVPGTDGGMSCLTGGCGPGTGDQYTCSGTGKPPATLVEWTLSSSGEDNYDISLVDGFNVPVNVYASRTDCPQPQCQVNINAVCPAILRTGLDANGVNLGCNSACDIGLGQEAFGNRDCCSGGYNDPVLCAICGVDYYNMYKTSCPMAYAYAYDEKSGTALWTCSASGGMADYVAEFCPDGTDYVGVGGTGNSSQWETDTATCTSKVTTGSSTSPLPTPTIESGPGTIPYTASGGTGVGSSVAPASYSAASYAWATASGSQSGGAPAIITSGPDGQTTVTMYVPSAEGPVTQTVTVTMSNSGTIATSVVTTIQQIEVTASATKEKQGDFLALAGSDGGSSGTLSSSTAYPTVFHGGNFLGVQ